MGPPAPPPGGAASRSQQSAIHPSFHPFMRRRDLASSSRPGPDTHARTHARNARRCNTAVARWHMFGYARFKMLSGLRAQLAGEVGNRQKFGAPCFCKKEAVYEPRAASPAHRTSPVQKDMYVRTRMQCSSVHCVRTVRTVPQTIYQLCPISFSNFIKILYVQKEI